MLASRGLELLKNLPETIERARQELTFQMALCVSLQITQGYGAPTVEQTYKRAIELCLQLGENYKLFWVLAGLFLVYTYRAELKTASELCEQMLSIAQNSTSPDLLAYAHCITANRLLHLGEFTAARDHCEQGLALYDPQHEQGLALNDPQRRYIHIYNVRYDHETSLLCTGARTLWFLGYPDQSLEKIREAIQLAEKLRYPENLGITLFCAALLRQLRHEAQRTLEQAEELIAHANEYGLVDFGANGASLCGWALVEMGHRAEGIAQIRQSLVAHGEAGSKIAGLHVSALLAEALLKDEQVEEGLALVDKALAAALRVGGYYSLAEIYRLKGELLLKFGSGLGDCGLKEAEECFHQSIQIAQRQSAKSLELRAVLSLSRLWRRQNKTKEARQTLLEIYNWFTEGFDTEDFKEARALLEELS
jgi:predicted ATPase